MIEIHDVLYVPDIYDTLYSIIEHGHQPDCSFVIKNGAITVGFTTFTLLEKTNKEINLYSDLPFKDQHSHPNYTNLLNDFNKKTMGLVHDKAAIPTRSTKESAEYNLHRVEQVSIKVSTPTLHTTQSKRFTSMGEGAIGSTYKASRTAIIPTAPLL